MVTERDVKVVRLAGEKQMEDGHGDNDEQDPEKAF